MLEWQPFIYQEAAMNTSRFARLQATREVRISHPRKSVDMTAGLAMVVFCLALGFQQVAIKSVIGDISSLAQIALRSALAFVLVAVLVRWRGISLHDLRARLGAGVGVGLGFTFEFVFVAWGLNYTLASHMSVFLYTAPVFAALSAFSGPRGATESPSMVGYSPGVPGHGVLDGANRRRGRSQGHPDRGRAGPAGRAVMGRHHPGPPDHVLVGGSGRADTDVSVGNGRPVAAASGLYTWRPVIHQVDSNGDRQPDLPDPDNCIRRFAAMVRPAASLSGIATRGLFIPVPGVWRAIRCAIAG